LSELPKLALSEAEVDEILRASGRIAIVVGGQALAIWAKFYQLEIPAMLAAGVTRDADFIGNADTALLVQGALGNKDWKFHQVRSGTLSPVAARLTLESARGTKEIDFLNSILGVHIDDLRSRAVPVALSDGYVVTVLHPLDVFASRLHNLAELTEKRNAKGVGQAALALRIAGAFLRDTIARGKEREVFGQIERLRDIVTEPSIAAVCRGFGFEVLACVPLAQVTNENFKTRRWPQIRRDIALSIGSVEADIG